MSIDIRPLGHTGLNVSVVGFGAWGIGGPAMAQSIPIGWGTVDDTMSVSALQHALDRGITCFDTADFYGLGHSEELIGRVIGNRPDVVIASKVGHRLNEAGAIFVDYSREHIIRACESSLRRLRRDHIDLYQLHSARLADLQKGECVAAMQQLQEQGKIRCWGISLNTYHPEPEAEYMMQHRLGQSFQLVLNILNQRAVPLLRRMQESGYGVIARMPLQFGLLTGKFTAASTFGTDDHRHFRLPPAVLKEALDNLAELWPLADELGVSPGSLSISFCASFPEVSTIIPGMKTVGQVDQNTTGIIALDEHVRARLCGMFETRLSSVLAMMETRG